MTADLSTLFTNLRLLRVRYPGIHRKLSQKIVNGVLDGLYRSEDGRYAYIVQDENQHSILIKESARQIEAAKKRVVILLGIGMGYQLFDVFRALRDEQNLIAVETRPDLLCKSMYLHDWRPLLNSPRFRLMLGFDRPAIHGLAEFLAPATRREDYLVLDNKVLVTIDQKLYSWWNLYFYLVSGLGYDSIRVINALMSGFNPWDPDNLYLNLPSEFLGKRPADLGTDEIFGRFRTLAQVLSPGLASLRSGELPWLKSQPPAGRPGRVSVVLLCWNRSDHTTRCLESLLGRTEYPDFEVIAVDNGSTDDTPELLRSLARQDSRLRPLFAGRNLGIVAGRQAGLEAASGEYVLFLDNDTEIERGDFMQVMVQALESHPNAGSTGAFATVYTSDRNDSFIQCVHVPGMVVPVAWCSGYCLMSRRVALDEIGGLEGEAFQPYGSEDVYLGYKLREHGWMTVSTADLVAVTHHIAHRDDHYDYDWQKAGSVNRKMLLERFGPRRRLLNPALDNSTVRGLWDPETRAFLPSPVYSCPKL
ncbi:glycosyltransferase family 2 protein [bacterium]|nr:glycosyltransferase family 2 protein [bacterium]